MTSHFKLQIFISSNMNTIHNFYQRVMACSEMLCEESDLLCCITESKEHEMCEVNGLMCCDML